jgi:hypothetical protein
MGSGLTKIFARRSLPRDWIAGVFLLLLLLGEQLEDSLALGFVGRSVEKKTKMLNILLSDEPIHAPSPRAFRPVAGRATSIKQSSKMSAVDI